MILEKLCSDVCNIARAAGIFIRKERKIFSLSSVEYKGPNDLVTYIDKKTEEQLVADLSKLLPAAGFITEEDSSRTKAAEYNWIIDPIDGTTNFVHGVPCYCISIALMQNEKIVLGVVYEINLDECFYAYKGGGAYLNGTRINVSGTLKLNKALLATGFPYTNYSRMKEYMEVFNYCMHHTHGLRRLGSAAVDLAYVACGRFDGFYEYGLNAWDVAAGAFIVEEAGGSVSDFTGGGNFVFCREIIATNKSIYMEFLKVVKEKFEKTGG